MIAAIVFGRSEQSPFPGRNTFPLLGRPLMTYALLAAKNASAVDRVFLSTDDENMALIGRHQGVATIERPSPLRGPHTPLELLLQDAFKAIQTIEKKSLEMIVVLLANAPTVTSQMISQGIEMLRANPALDAAMAVTPQSAYSPSYALRVTKDGLLAPYLAHSDNDGGQVYFPTALLWVLRGAWLNEGLQADELANTIVNPARHRTAPLVHEGYGDVDFPWQIPAVENWLLHNKFTEKTTPYDVVCSTSRTGKDDGQRRSERRSAPEKCVFVSTVPFSEHDPTPLSTLKDAGLDVAINPLGRRLTEAELAAMLAGSSVLVAGTEPITRAVMKSVPTLKMISRVGIGLDNVDLVAAREFGIQVSYTPEAPAPAVAELAVGQILALLRHLSLADRQMRNGVWVRLMGRRLSGLTVGLCGVGRIGGRVAKHLAGGFPGIRLLGFDLHPNALISQETSMRWVSKEELLSTADVVSVHLPLTPQTKNFITKNEIDKMKSTAVLINTARGGIVHEHDLAESLRSGRLAGAAVDVFENEPYAGELAGLSQTLLSCHMGSMSVDCRVQMEKEAVNEAVRFVKGLSLQSPVPEAEYQIAIDRVFRS